MWLWLTYASHDQSFLINMDKVFTVYTTSRNETVVEYTDGNAVHVKETPVQIMEKMNRHV